MKLPQSLVFSLSLFVSSVAQAAPLYHVVNLGTLGGSQSTSYGINDAGQVTGLSELTGSNNFDAFVSNGSTMTDLGNLGGGSSVGYSINNSGQVTGYFATSPFTGSHAFKGDGTTMTDLGTLGGFNSYGRSINDAGQVAGDSNTFHGPYHAFVWNGSAMTDLGTLGADTIASGGYAINNTGQVTGYSYTPNGGGQHIVIWNGATIVDLGTLGGTDGWGNAINDSGQIAGVSQITGNSAYHAFVSNGTSLIDLGTLGGLYSWGYGINNAGQVVGASGDAFLWDSGTMYDINNLLDSSGSGWSIYDARDINNKGQIGATGCHTDEAGNLSCVALRLDPVLPATSPTTVPEPAPAAIFGIGLIALGMSRRRH